MIFSILQTHISVCGALRITAATCLRVVKSQFYINPQLLHVQSISIFLSSVKDAAIWFL